MTTVDRHKFLRAHLVKSSIASNAKAIPWTLKLLYEFWGFCVNGGNDLRVPGSGAFPTNAISMPIGFESGSLLVSGSDGVTRVGTAFFSSSAGVFTSAHVGKHIVAWKSGSNSTDDSIYEITNFISSTVVRVDTRSGGTPFFSASNEPWFSERSNINFRVLDLESTNNLTYASGNYVVVNLPGASEINPGQVTPQCKLTLVLGTQTSLRPTMSPSGSWTGSAFTDGREFIANTGNTGEWSAGSTGTGKISIIANPSMIFTLFGGDQGTTSNTIWSSSGGSHSFFIEVPSRIYPREIDPNPFVVMMNGYEQQTTDRNSGWNAFRMIRGDGQVTRMWSLVKTLTGASYNTVVYASNSSPDAGVQTGREEAMFNRHTNQVWMTDIVLGCDDVNHYTMARARIRNVRHVLNAVPEYTMFGSVSGDMWIKLNSTICVPWDGARLPYGLVNSFM